MTGENKLKTHWMIAGGLVVFCFVSAAIAFPYLPERIPIHFNMEGKPDGWGGRATIFIMPAMVGFMVGLMAGIPWLSPKGFSIDDHHRVYGALLLILTGLFCFIHVCILLGTFWEKMPTRILIAGLLAFLALLGNQLGRVERNFFVGVRTPWTIASERVWIETHRLAAWLSVAACGLGLLLLAIPAVPAWAPFIVAMAGLVYPALHSLILYKRLEARGEL
ncbi:MAG TPA: DUF1648 domain-containing protein [Planctomycetia bacterium]|nr:DUF1648 domain-containing protein [Planctomycetia bacterium]